MRTYPIHPSGAGSGSRPAATGQPDAAKLIGELQYAGLLSVEVDEDGDLSFTLTPSGRRTAQLMAMSRDGLALVLLGALVGTGRGPH